MQIRISIFLLLALAVIPANGQQCFFTTSWNTGSSAYIGNGITHSEKTGKNYFIFDGPAFYVDNPCVTAHVAFVVTQTDGYKNHYVCQGGPATANNGASCTSCVGAICQPLPIVCKGGAVCSSPIPNTYDVGIYCAGGGTCQMGKLYAHVGALKYDIFFDCVHHPTQCATFGQSKRYVLTLDWKDGATLLPSGNYAIGMGTSCDDGRQLVPGRGTGDIRCGTGAGEGGPYGYNGFTTTNNPDGAVKAGTSLMAYKYFTSLTPQTACLTYDDFQGLIPDIGPGSPCNFSSVPVNGAGQAPHILNFAVF